MKPKKIAAAAALFVTSAALPFALLAPKTATSATRGITARVGCMVGNPTNLYICLGVVGSDFSTANLDGAWFEFIRWSASPMTVTGTLKRATFTGTISQDAVSVPFAGSGHGEIFVPSVNTKQNGWQYDFLFAEFYSTNTAYAPVGVFYEFN